jgi:glycosyltransferase involved in cell wall biosynthesis
MTRRHGGGCGPSCRAIATWRQAALRRRPPEVVVAISEAILGWHPDIRGRRATRVLRHPADPVDTRRTPIAGGHTPVFGYLGQLTPNKGIEFMLTAARTGGHRLVVAGRGRLEQRVRQAGDLVEYVGWVSGSERERFFDRIDCLLVPSAWEEPAGLAVNEAYARGIPVIASRTGGLAEYVPDSCASLLVRPGDAADLDAAMAKFATDPLHYLPGRPDETRSWDRHVRDLLDVYELAAS